MTRRKAACACSVSKSPMCWLMKTWLPTESATAFFRCASHCQNWLIAVSESEVDGASAASVERDGQRRVTSRAAQNQFAVQHHAHNRIVHVPHNRTVMDEKNIGDAAAAVRGLVFVRANRLIAQVAAGGDDGETEFGQQQMMQRRVRQHDAEIRVIGATDGQSCQRMKCANGFVPFILHPVGFLSVGKSERVRRSSTMGASGERNSRSSSGETSHSALMLSRDGNMSAKGFSSRCFRSRRRRTASSLRASTIK